MHSSQSVTTISVTASSGMSGDAGGPISKVLILGADAHSALAALMGSLETIADTPGLNFACNQMEALFDLRKAAFLY